MRLSRAAVVVASALLSVTALAACAQEESSPTPQASGSDACAPENLALKTPGQVTIATSDPAFPPYVIKNDPTNGKGFESAVGYAVAEQLGFSADQVEWTFSTFPKLFAPGEKDYDFALNQIGITEKRAQAVDFSDPYYEAANAVLVLGDSPYAGATTLAELQDAKIGVQVATTSQAAVESQIAPTQDVAVFDDSTAATQALKNGQIDAFVTDLPTALYLAAVPLYKQDGTVVGQLPQQESADTWGLVLQKGSALTTCVNQALAALTESGELQQITDKWMTEYTDAPVLG
jgi:polar amino acid transport system substrate-binding protein